MLFVIKSDKHVELGKAKGLKKVGKFSYYVFKFYRHIVIILDKILDEFGDFQFFLLIMWIIDQKNHWHCLSKFLHRFGKDGALCRL